MSKTQLQTNNAKLSALITELQGKAAGGGGGLETCEVTIVQEWGGNDDPALLYVYVYGYKIENGSISPFFATMTSDSDYEPQHSVTITGYKNTPIMVICRSAYFSAYATTTSEEGGVVSEPITITDMGTRYFYTVTPTADEATFTFATP